MESWCHSHQATSRPGSNQSEPQESELIGKRAAFDANLMLVNSQTWIKLKQE